MTEIKFIGRGGQGAVIASQILAKVFFLMGKYPQCFSVFGGERRGAPVASFLRVDEKKIFLKCEIRRPIFSGIRIHGDAVSLSGSQKSRVKAEMDNFFVKWNRLQAGRTAGWTSAESVGDIVSTLDRQEERIWPRSTSLEGEYGMREVSMGVPVRLGSDGVEEIVEFPLEPSERTALEASAASIREMIKDGETLLRQSQ